MRHGEANCSLRRDLGFDSGNTFAAMSPRNVATNRGDAMPKRTEQELGRVTIRLREDGKWAASWWDKAARKLVRRVLPVTSYKQAVESATKTNTDLITGDGYIPSRRSKGGHSIKQAFDETIRFRRANDTTKEHYTFLTNQFTEWLTEFFPGLSQWGDLRPMHVEAYIQWAVAQGYAFDTVRLRIAPIRATAIYMADNYDRYKEITRKIKLPARQGRNSRAVAGQAELDKFLEYTVEHYPALAPIVALQALAGLRVLEALTIREQDIDFAAKTVTVAETPIHKPKTADSARTIPACDSLLAVLGRALGQRKVIHREGYAFITRRGKPWTRSGYHDAVKGLMREFSRDTKIEIVGNMAPREFRATFASMVRAMGADFRVVQVYLGQSAPDILARHYERLPIERMRAEITARMNASKVGAALYNGNTQSEAKNGEDCHSTDIGDKTGIEIIALTA